MDAEIRGLSRLPEEDLTNDEAMAVSAAMEDEQDAQSEYEKDMEILMAALADDPNAPSRDDIEYWQDEYGHIQISSVMNEGDVYIWRVLKRQEYKQMSKENQLSDQMRAEEYTVRRCMLYPKATASYVASAPAGVISSLYSQIMYKSGFIPESALMRSIKEI